MESVKLNFFQQKSFIKNVEILEVKTSFLRFQKKKKLILLEKKTVILLF